LEAAQFTCINCGGSLEFKPGTQNLTCPFCGTVNENPEITPPEIHEELNYEKALEKLNSVTHTKQVQVVTCNACGGEVTLEPGVTTADCDFCGSHIIAGGQSHTVMTPQYLLPFSIEKSTAVKSFREWIKRLKFAPNELKKQARITEPAKGIYYPFWTFDADTETDYSGRRGIHHTRKVTSTDSSGKTTTSTVVETKWYPARGKVRRLFDDILIPASRTLVKKLLQRLKIWDFKNMVEYSDYYLSGFKGESYSIGLKEGLEDAKEIMTVQIRQDIRRDIGGDVQQITSMNTRYRDITFKYILLPLWVVVYKFNKKYYQVLINGSNGEIKGERPVSILKILLLILIIAGAGAGIYFLVRFFR